MISYILNLFKKKKKVKKQLEEIIYLDKWNRLKKLPDTYLYDLFRLTDLENIVVALTHSDQRMIDRFIDCSRLFHKEEKLKTLLEQSDVSKYKSDKMKAYLANVSGLDNPDYLQYEPYDSF